MSDASAARPGIERHLCICADDFGMSAGINAAVVELAHLGKLSATGGMVRRGAWLQGARALRGLPPSQLDVGLHLDLTRPERIDGPEPGLARLLAATCTRTAAPRRLMDDIREQLTRFEDAIGRPPAFVDGHRHVHQLPVVRKLLVEEIWRRYSHSPPWLRNTMPGGALRREGLKAAAIHALGGRALQRQASSRKIPGSRGLLGVYDFAGDARSYRARLHGWLNTARTGDVLMCHPASDVSASHPHAVARVQEYDVLRTTDFPWHAGMGIVRPALLSRLLRQGLVERAACDGSTPDPSA
jgi:predicted glycoside hydrolase/deacetylase ChbG (UPF0249 family)